jgi:hypothetical protein
MISVDHFTFTRHRAGSPDLAFRPDAGAALAFASLSADTLTLGNMRAGVLRAGDSVSVARGGATVFRGDAEVRTWHGWRGTSVEESFTVLGPWHRLARLPFTQTWMTMVERVVEGQTVLTLEPVGSSRVVLNQGDAGLSVSVREQVTEILAAAAARGIIAAPSAADVEAIPETLTLPYDESRDLTCAQALARELRFTPSLAVRFDYSTNPPALRVLAPAAENAGWLAEAALSGALLDVRETETGLPPLGCLLEITVTGTVEGAPFSFSSAQIAGDTSDPERTLRAVLPVSGSEFSADRRKLDLVCHEIPSDLNNAAWWRLWHADLKIVPAAGLAIRDASRTGGGDLSLYPRFVATGGVGMAELEEAGVAHFRVERLLCTAVVTTSVYLGEGQSAESVETADLSLEIIATDAETHTYRWTASSDSMTGETVPAGLAAALLAAHQADGLSAEVLCSLKTGAAIPLPGDTRNGLAATAVSVDCRTLSVSVGFGPPAALGPVDLAGFLAGFRNLRRSGISTRRNTGEDAEKAETDETFLLPATSSGWAKRGDNKVSVAPAAGASGGKATLDPADLNAGDEAKFREIAIPGAEGEDPTYYKVLATEGGPTSDPAPGAGPSGGCTHGDFPGSAGGGGGGAETEGGGSDRPFPGAGAGTSSSTDRNHTAFPGKTGPCW